MKNTTHEKGFSLVELLVGLAMASIVMAAIFLTYQAQVQGKIAQEVSLEMQQAGRAAITLMTRDLRMAGCDPEGTADAGFVTAEEQSLRFTYDIRGDADKESDGDVDDDAEGVGYGISTGGHLGREFFNPETLATGGLQPLVMNADWLNFVYLDEDSNPIGDPGSNLEDIRSVEITFVVRGAGSVRGLLRTFEDNTTYTNQQPSGTAKYATWTPSGDKKKFRRMRFATIVHCRNMGNDI